MQNKINLDTHNEVIPVNEPWHRGSGFTWMLLALAGAVLFFSGAVAKAQVGVTYTMQTGNFNSLQTQRNNNPPYAGTYNNGATELAQYANGGSFGNTPGAAAFQTFTTTGNGNSGSVRTLQVGDTFTITAYVGANPSAGGGIGISFRDSTTYNSYSDVTGEAEARFQLDSSGGWKVYNAGTAVDSGLGSASDRTFTIKVTSGNTFTATVGGNTYYDLSMAAGGGTIDSFAIYTLGDSNQNSFWKNASLNNTGTIELGWGANNNETRTISGVISDGLAANSTSTLSANTVTIGGNTGSQINISGNNSYTGLTTINANATAEAQNANAFGSTAAGTTVTAGGTLKLYDGTGITYANEGLTLNGNGVGSNGALRNTGGNNTWGGGITLGSASLIRSDAGSLTINGGISGANNLTVGGAANTTIGGAITTSTGSLTKQGDGTLTLTGANNYSGGTTVSGGKLAGNTTSIQGNVANNATLEFNQSANGTYSGAVSGTGKLIKTGSADLTLSGNNTYIGNTEIDAGALKLSGSIASGSKVYVGNGGLSDNAELNLSGTTALGSAVQVNTGTGTRTISKNDGTSQTISGAFENNKASTISVTDASGNLTMSGVASGSGALTKSGSGTLTLSGSGANTRSGGTDVDAGTLVLAKDAGVNAVAGQVNIASGAAVRTDAANQLGGNLVNSSGGALNLNNNSQVLALAGSGTVQLGNATLTLSNTANDTFSGVISGTGAVEKKGAGTQYLTGANDYTGTTTISAGTVEIQNATALGTIAAGTTVANNAQLKLYHGTAMTVAEALTLNGDGGGSGALRNVGGDNIVSGTITLGSSARINADIAGSLSISGNVSGGNNVLYVGGTQNSAISGIINGGGASQNGTTTSLYKNGSGTLTLSGGNNYTGDTRVVSGNLTVASGGSLGNGSDVFVSSNGVLTVNASTTIASLREAGEGDSGTAVIGSGATLTINGANSGTNYFSTISGAGNLTFSGSGNSIASLFNNQTYTGTTTVTDGKLISSGALSSAAYSISGGTFESVGDSKIRNDASIAISGGNFIVGGNDTVGAVTATGGRLSVAAGKTVSLSASSSIGSGAEIVGGKIEANSGTTLTVNSVDTDNTSALSVASGGTLKGSFRTTGELSVDGVLAPGNSTGISYVGATTFLGGGRYQWEVDTFGPGAVVGTNWDFLNITGSLTISASSSSQFLIDIISLVSTNDTAGLATGFNLASNYSFAIATASEGISGFDVAAFAINTSGFQNSMGAGNPLYVSAGSWSVSQSGNNLMLNYTGATAIPEPNSAALVLVGLAATLLNRRRRRG